MKNYIFENKDINGHAQEMFALLNCSDVKYFVIETAFIENHVERIHHNSDRGRVKWIAETRTCAYEQMHDNPKAGKSHIDGADCFPRFYFHIESFINELIAFLNIRMQEIHRIIVPLEYSPEFDHEMYVKCKLWQCMPVGAA